MFGCYYNPFLFMTTMLGCSGYNYCSTPFGGDYLQKEMLAGQAAIASHASLGPYGWVSNWGGHIQLNTFDPNLSLNTVLNLKQMMYDPTYIPDLSSTYMDTGKIQQLAQKGYQEGVASADKTILKVKYNSTLNGTTTLVEEIKKFLKAEGISEADKKELEKIQKTAEELKKKLEDYAKTSKDKEVKTAIEEVEAMQGELVTLKKNATDIAKKIVETKQAAGGAAQSGQAAASGGAAGGAAQSGQAATSGGAAGSAAQSGQAAASGGAAGGAAQSGQAAASGGAAGGAAQSGQAATSGDTAVVDEQIEQNLDNEYIPYLRECIYGNENLSPSDKKAIVNKIKAIQKAKGENKLRLYNEFIKFLAKVEENIEKNRKAKVEQASEICKDLYKASAGIDYGIPFKKTDNEKAIQDIVYNKINKDNIVYVLDEWINGGYSSDENFNNKQEGQASRTGDSCMLQTIFGEFKGDGTAKRLLATRLIEYLKAAAKAKNRLESINSSIATIEGEIKHDNSWTWDYTKIYNAFRKIHSKLSNINTKQEK